MSIRLQGGELAMTCLETLKLQKAHMFSGRLKIQNSNDLGTPVSHRNYLDMHWLLHESTIIADHDGYWKWLSKFGEPRMTPRQLTRTATHQFNIHQPSLAGHSTYQG